MVLGQEFSGDPGCLPRFRAVVVNYELNLLTENAPLGIDLLNRHSRASNAGNAEGREWTADAAHGADFDLCTDRKTERQKKTSKQVDFDVPMHNGPN